MKINHTTSIPWTQTNIPKQTVNRYESVVNTHHGNDQYQTHGVETITTYHYNGSKVTVRSMVYYQPTKVFWA